MATAMLGCPLTLFITFTIEVMSQESWTSPSVMGVEMCRELCEKRGGCSRMCYDFSTLQCTPCSGGRPGTTIYPRNRGSTTCPKHHVRIVTRRGQRPCVREGTTFSNRGLQNPHKKCTHYIEGLSLNFSAMAAYGKRSCTEGDNYIKNGRPTSNVKHNHAARVPFGCILNTIFFTSHHYYFTLDIFACIPIPGNGNFDIFSFRIIKEYVDLNTTQSALVERGFSFSVNILEEKVIIRQLSNPTAKPMSFHFRYTKYFLGFETDFFLDTHKSMLCLLKQTPKNLACEYNLASTTRLRAEVYLTASREISVEISSTCNNWHERVIAKIFSRKGENLCPLHPKRLKCNNRK